jgi:hypothetical protein
MVDGILIWHKIDSPVIQEYLKNANSDSDYNKTYISKMDQIKKIQIKNEEDESKIDKPNKNSTEIENNCREWYES